MGLNVSILLTCFIYLADGAECVYTTNMFDLFILQMALSVPPLENVLVMYLVLPLTDGSHVLKPLRSDGAPILLLLITAAPRAASNHNNGYQG